ncbi:MAG: hypothetical protein KDB62_10595, partial [Solirubrobacterales bacterium]|nr:hypothetical protein [Solirubrobacterales bacterium]
MTHAIRLGQRARVLSALRACFDARGFIEIEAPVAVVSPGLEPHLDAFELRTDGPRRFLHTSPEYALKRLLGAGLTRVYSMGPCFRDEPPSRTHSPEFTMLEWYAAGLDLGGLMDQTEGVVRAARAAVGRGPVVYRGLSTHIEAPFERLTVRAAFQRYAGLDPWAHPTVPSLAAACKARGFRDPGTSDWDDLFFQVFLDAIEPKLGQE